MSADKVEINLCTLNELKALFDDLIAESNNTDGRLWPLTHITTAKIVELRARLESNADQPGPPTEDNSGYLKLERRLNHDMEY